MAEESLSLMWKSRDVLATPNHERFETILKHLSMPKETNEFQKAFALFNFCATYFPNCYTLKLLNVYRSSSNDEIKNTSIVFLSESLAEFRTRKFNLSPDALHEIKPVLIEILSKKETKESDFKILRKIVSFITYNGEWDELSYCIISLLIEDPLKAFHVFIDLPQVSVTFIDNIMDIIVDKAEKVLLNAESDRAEDWSLALETVVKMGIQLLGIKRTNLVRMLLDILVRSVEKLVEKRVEEFLVKGLEDLERFLSGDKILFRYNKTQCLFLQTFMFKIKDFGTQTKEITDKIHELGNHPEDPTSILVKPRVNPASKLVPVVVKPKEDQVDGADLKTLSSVNILKMFAYNDLDERSREMAIKRLEVVLSDHISKKVEIDIAEIRELQPLLISCLGKEGISDNMFRIVGELLGQVVSEMYKHQDVAWDGLRDYIASQSETNFQRAVYIFQCLANPLEGKEFVIRVMDDILPVIRINLNPPTDLSVDNGFWGMAFTSAFCATIHLIRITTHADLVKEIAKKMIDSVSELVERGTDIGIVRKAFSYLQIIVKEQLGWYKRVEYKFVKGLLMRLYAIRGMKWDSKMELWRISEILEKRVNQEVKELPKGESDWLNLPEA